MSEPDERTPPYGADNNGSGGADVEWSFGYEDVLATPSSLPRDRHRLRRGALHPNARQGAATPPDAAVDAPPDGTAMGGLVQPFLARGGEQRAQSVRTRLDVALDGWWAGRAMPPPALLRDGLLALEAGHRLDEAQRSLLLRAALAHRRGLITALRHQTDPERTAFLLQEALLDEGHPLPPAELLRMLQEDEHAAAWAEPLATGLAAEAALTREPRNTLALTALALLEHRLPLDSAAVPLRSAAAGSAKQTAAQSRRGPVVLLLLLALTVALTLAWQQPWPRPGQGAPVPAGAYAIGDADSRRTAQVAAFRIDRTEVTHRAYRRCVEQGACPPPASADSATRPGYFTDPAFDLYPAVNVTWAAADAFCRWSGQRLPTADEWEIAASVAPASGLTFRYPWGDVYEPQLANSVDSGAGDTQAVALYHPAGDSPFGVSDLAGNAAEWTATPGDNPDTALVKGGAFGDGPELLRAAAWRAVPRGTAAPWLGFRCATTLPGD